MQNYQTNPYLFVSICLLWLAVIGLFGAYKVFWKEYKEPPEDSAKQQ